MIKLKHKLLTALLALLMILPSLPALAQEAQAGQVTTHFLGVHTSNCTVGIALAPAQTRQGDPITAPTIQGRTFVGYEQETTHVYSPITENVKAASNRQNSNIAMPIWIANTAFFTSNVIM